MKNKKKTIILITIIILIVLVIFICWINSEAKKDEKNACIRNCYYTSYNEYFADIPTDKMVWMLRDSYSIFETRDQCVDYCTAIKIDL